ncbi:class I SAM-dependent methyltransferase [Candidatus Uhrbacteria bacterium]|nr:class I SAM-dependent methyltransferase [Candidatus Uhrbacteria bacterium]
MFSPVLLLLIIALIGLTAVSIYLSWWFYWQLQPLMHGGGPYVPSQAEEVRRMVEAAELTPSDVVYDLGSGDGRILFHAVASSGCQGVGYEIDPGLVRRAQAETTAKGLDEQLRFERKNFWHVPLGNATVVFLYQLPRTMKGLKRKLCRELPVGARIVSNNFVFPGWEPERIDGTVRRYRHR